MNTYPLGKSSKGILDTLKRGVSKRTVTLLASGALLTGCSDGIGFNAGDDKMGRNPQNGIPDDVAPALPAPLRPIITEDNVISFRDCNPSLGTAYSSGSNAKTIYCMRVDSPDGTELRNDANYAEGDVLATLSYGSTVFVDCFTVGERPDDPVQYKLEGPASIDGRFVRDVDMVRPGVGSIDAYATDRNGVPACDNPY